jgi:hypothetical protein
MPFYNDNVIGKRCWITFLSDDETFEKYAGTVQEYHFTAKKTTTKSKNGRLAAVEFQWFHVIHFDDGDVRSFDLDFEHSNTNLAWDPIDDDGAFALPDGMINEGDLENSWTNKEHHSTLALLEDEDIAAVSNVHKKSRVRVSKTNKKLTTIRSVVKAKRSSKKQTRKTTSKTKMVLPGTLGKMSSSTTNLVVHVNSEMSQGLIMECPLGIRKYLK